jgi:hypothetical protein
MPVAMPTTGPVSTEGATEPELPTTTESDVNLTDDVVSSLANDAGTLEPGPEQGDCDAARCAAELDAGASNVEPSTARDASATMPDASLDASQVVTDAAAVTEPEPEASCWPSIAQVCGDCAELSACESLTHLTHRYSFSGDGQVVSDEIAGDDGEVIGTSLSGDGLLDLNGNGQYVELPAGLLGSSSSLTFETWLRWQGGSPWQRIFDFGNRMFNQPRTYLFVTPLSANASGAALAVSYSTMGSDQAVRVAGPSALGSEWAHVVCVFDGVNHTLQLYWNGELQVDTEFDLDLSRIVDDTNRLGRSLFGDDPDLAGTLDEFRIYDEALSAEQVVQSYALGPDVLLPN